MEPSYGASQAIHSTQQAYTHNNHNPETNYTQNVLNMVPLQYLRLAHHSKYSNQSLHEIKIGENLTKATIRLKATHLNCASNLFNFLILPIAFLISING